MRATDVHLEPFENRLAVRYRIDGMLCDAPIPEEASRFQRAIVSRIKIMSNLNIAETRLPQDGRLKLLVHGREIDVRVSIIPMLFGEGVVLRLLDKSNLFFSLEKLGMARRHPRRIHATSSPGPTASSSSPAPPAAARPPRSTPRSRRSAPRNSRSSPSRTPSSTSSTASTRYR